MYLPGRGVYLPGGGVYLPGGCTCQGVYLPREVYLPRGVYLPRYSPREKNNRQVQKYYLVPNFVLQVVKMVPCTCLVCTIHSIT